MLAIQKLHLLNFGHNLLTSNDLVRLQFRLLHNRSSQWQHRRPDYGVQSGLSRLIPAYHANLAQNPDQGNCILLVFHYL